MRVKVVLGAVPELITGTQLATDVETNSSNTNSNRSPANNSHCRAFFLGGGSHRERTGGLRPIKLITIHVHHAEIIAQVAEERVVTDVGTNGLFDLLNLMQQGDLSGGR